MKRKAPWPTLLALLALATVAALVACSLRPLSATVIVRVGGGEAMRVNPELSEMSHFAIAISNGPSDSLSPADVQLRSRDCLKLRGLVTFPLTLSELLAGVSISIPLGSYHIAVVGYSDTAGNYTSVAPMFAGSPSLKSFLIAEGDYNTVASSNVVLSSIYDKGTAMDLMVSCPIPGGNTMQTIAYIADVIMHLTNPTINGNDWSFAEALPGRDPLTPSFFVDPFGIVSLSYAKTTPAISLEYAQQIVTAGAFTMETVTAHPSLVPSAVATDANGSTFVFYPDPVATNKLVGQRRTTNGVFGATFEVGTAAGSAGYTRLFAAAGANVNTVAVVGSTDLAATPLELFTRSTAGMWANEGPISYIGALQCNLATYLPAIDIDAQGKIHLAYGCDTSTGHYLGYATNQTGSWGYTVLNSSGIGTPFSGVSLDVDPTGWVHIAATAGLDVYYTRTPASATNPAPLSIVTSLPQASQGVRIKGINQFRVEGLVVYGAGTSFLHPLSFDTGWGLGSNITSTTLGIDLYAPIF